MKDKINKLLHETIQFTHDKPKDIQNGSVPV